MMSLVLIAIATAISRVMGQMATASGSSSASGSQMTTTSASSSTQSGCPTVTLTSDICNTCIIPMCVELVPLTVSCGCPSAMSTIFASHPCAKGCAGLGCQTKYAFFTATNCTDPSTATSTSGSGAGNATTTGNNSTMTGPTVTSMGTTSVTTTPGGTGTGPSTSSSSAAAMRVQPFWAVWL